jgi:hypothetical protein
LRPILNGRAVFELPAPTPRKSLLRANLGLLKRLRVPAEGLVRLPNFSKE